MKKENSAPEKEKKTEKLTFTRIMLSALPMLISLGVLIYITMAWFSNNTGVTATGASVSLPEMGTVRVFAEADATDEALTAEQVATTADGERLFMLQNDNEDETEIGPGSSGSFSFWVDVPDNANITVKPLVCPGGVSVTRSDGEVTGVHAENSFRDGTTTGAQTKAENYLQGHILLFMEKSQDNVYSGWLTPDETNTLEIDTLDTDNYDAQTGRYHFTVYWVWVDSYRKLYTDDELIAAADLDAIQAQNNTTVAVGAQNIKYSEIHVFDTRNNEITNDTSAQMLSHYYDYGDEDIGISVEHIYFDLTFTL